MSEPANALVILAHDLASEESVISDHLVDPDQPPALGMLAAAGPATAADPGAYAFVVEAVREGYLLHYGEPRLLAPPDRDLALLAGDFLYAKGLQRLATLDDLAALGELADLISLAAKLHAEPPSTGLAAALAQLWLGTVIAIAAGPSEPHQRAKSALRSSGAVQPLYAATVRTAAEAGLGDRLVETAEAVGFEPFHLG